jgi:hypothetical protein
MQANPRSRAAKRAVSPSIDINKSLKEAPRASDATPALAARQHGGIHKAKKKQKSMKRGQRARQERGLARAEAVMDQMTKKMDSAQCRTKKRRDRRALWEDVNDASKEARRTAPKFQVVTNDADDLNEEWVDEDGDGDAEMKIIDGVKVPANAAGTKLVVVDRTASSTASEVDELDEIT